MSNKVYRIGEAAKLLEVKTSVLRFWEEEFSQVRPKRTDKGQRYYSERDMEILTKIRSLLYDEGMTISGAQKTLQKQRAGIDSNNIPSEKISSIPSKTAQKNTQLNFTGLNPEFHLPNDELANTTQTTVQISDFSYCENCKENTCHPPMNAPIQTDVKTTMDTSVATESANSYVQAGQAAIYTEQTATMQAMQSQIKENLEIQAQYRESILEIQVELKKLLEFLSNDTLNSLDKNKGTSIKENKLE